MKSVFKTVAPIAMTITFSLSGVAMAETAATASTSADTVKTQPEKPAVHHKHKAKTEAAAPSTSAPVAVEKSTSTTAPAAIEKVAPAATDASKKVEPAKTK